MGRRRDRGCPCGLPAAYDRCCGRFHRGEPAPTAEVLMRARYTAYAREDGAYLLASWHSSTRPATLPFDPSLRWTRLQVVATTGGGLLDPRRTAWRTDVMWGASATADGEPIT